MFLSWTSLMKNCVAFRCFHGKTLEVVERIIPWNWMNLWGKLLTCIPNIFQGPCINDHMTRCDQNSIEFWTCIDVSCSPISWCKRDDPSSMHEWCWLRYLLFRRNITWTGRWWIKEVISKLFLCDDVAAQGVMIWKYQASALRVITYTARRGILVPEQLQIRAWRRSCNVNRRNVHYASVAINDTHPPCNRPSSHSMLHYLGNENANLLFAFYNVAHPKVVSLRSRKHLSKSRNDRTAISYTANPLLSDWHE